MMGGEIWVESEAGIGSQFQFTVRLPVQSEEQQQRFEDIELPENLCVLVVDDNASAREILVSMLDSLNIPVETAKFGAEAIKMVNGAIGHNPYDVIFMDWKMPGMDGIDTARAIQEQLGERAPKIVLVTAYGQEEAKEQAVDVELSTILTKPVSASTLLDSILESQGLVVTKKSRSEKTNEDALAAREKLSGAHLLLVEDNEINQELAVELLESAGLNISVVGDGQQALDILLKRDFDGILMDCQMPVMDGYEATRKIREQDKYKDLPVIAMTANAMAGDKEKVLAAGMNDHIGKPIDVDAMFITLSHWVKDDRVSVDPEDEPRAAVEQSSLSSEETTQPLPDLSGIDTKVGLQITQGNEKLYRRILIKFRKSQHDFIQQFSDAMSSSDVNAPTRVAHTLKGVAANIGATALKEAAWDLEHACEHGAVEEDFSALVEMVKSHLDPVIEGLSSLETRIDTNIASTNFRPTATQIQQLEDLLKDDDGDATDVVEKWLELGPAQEVLSIMTNINEAVAAYDFDEALEILALLKKETEQLI